MLTDTVILRALSTGQQNYFKTFKDNGWTSFAYNLHLKLCKVLPHPSAARTWLQCFFRTHKLLWAQETGLHLLKCSKGNNWFSCKCSDTF